MKHPITLPKKGKAKHLIVTIHGIRTHGKWQGELEKIIREAVEGGATLPLRELPEFIHRKYQYFSLVAFWFPPARWMQARNFRRELENWVVNNPAVERIDIFSHSFGTYIASKAITKHYLSRELPQIKNLVVAGSVLPAGFPWDAHTGSKIDRVVSECGTRDNIIFLNRLTVPFLGAAGLLGFQNSEGRSFVQRFFDVGHSGYFENDNSGDSSWFLRKYWLPIALGAEDGQLEPRDERRPLNALEGIRLFLINNATFLKTLLVCFAVFTGAKFLNDYRVNRNLAVSRAHAARAESLSGNVLNPVREAPEAVRQLLAALPALPEREAESLLAKLAFRFAPVKYAGRPISFVTAAPKGNRIAVASRNTVQVLSLGKSASGSQHIVLPDEAVRLVAFSGNGEWLAALGSQSVGILKLDDAGSNSRFLNGQYSLIDMDENGQQVALKKEDGGLEVVRLKDRRAILMEEHVASLFFLSDSSLVYTLDSGALLIARPGGPAERQPGERVKMIKRSLDRNFFSSREAMRMAINPSP
jgi:hypothetical protein